jgi:hypothetical protein
MSQDNPFAKLGAIDQKLFQETAPKPAEKAAEKEPIGQSHNAGMPANKKSSKLASQTSGKREIQQNWHNQNS